jgi:Rieske Fe-S protein
MERRLFLQSVCGIGALTTLGGCATLVTFQVSDKTIKQIKVPLSAFVDKKGQPVTKLLVKHASLEYPILLIKDQNQALYLQCTHHDHNLEIQEDGLKCNEHGSLFAKDGAVKEGPAKRPLKSYPVQQIQNELVFSI